MTRFAVPTLDPLAPSHPSSSPSVSRMTISVRGLGCLSALRIVLSDMRNRPAAALAASDCGGSIDAARTDGGKALGGGEGKVTVDGCGPGCMSRADGAARCGLLASVAARSAQRWEWAHAPFSMRRFRRLLPARPSASRVSRRAIRGLGIDRPVDRDLTRGLRRTDGKDMGSAAAGPSLSSRSRIDSTGVGRPAEPLLRAKKVEAASAILAKCAGDV